MMNADDQTLQSLARRVADELNLRDAKLATAESCTGGWLAKTLTDLPGSSAWFEYGFVTYGNNAKAALLGVPAVLIEREGAVSRAVAEQMAAGALTASGADIAVAVTGIAGPDGGSSAKPVGLVWFAWAGPRGELISREIRFAGDRAAIRRQAVAEALSGVLSMLAGNE